MLGNKIFSFFKTAVKFTVLISVVLFLISKPASTDSLSVQADYYAQPKSLFKGAGQAGRYCGPGYFRGGRFFPRLHS